MGYWGRNLARNFAELGALDAVVDPMEPSRAEAKERWPGTRVFSELAPVLEDPAIAGVAIASPAVLHAPLALEAIAAGKDVFVEKPQSLDIGQAAGFARAIERAGVVSQVGFMSRYYPSAEFTRQLLTDRIPRHAQLQMFYSGSHIRYWTSRYELCGGSFVENTVHLVDLLRYFLGDIDKVSAFYFERQPEEGPEPINMPHAYDVNYRFASGVVANATTSRVLTNVKASRREVVIVSDDSLIEWSTGKVVENGETVWEAEGNDNAFVLQAHAFVEAVRAKDTKAMRSPYTGSLNSLAAVLGANASAEQGGRVIDLGDFAASDSVRAS